MWFLIFVLGSAVGSFLNVVVDRFNTGLPWWKGSSFCFSCGEKLKPRDLFPVFSYLFLKGRCATCHAKIPATSVAVELLMGVLSVLAFFKFGLVSSFSGAVDWAQYFLALTIFSSLVLIALYDLRHFIIPDSFLLFFALSSVLFVLDSSASSIVGHLVSALVLPLPFLALFLISKGRWLGLGDVKYMAVLGLLLGMAFGSSAILLAFWIGAGFTLILLLVNRKTLTIKSEVPFGPFISIGIAVGFYFGLDILHLNDILALF